MQPNVESILVFSISKVLEIQDFKEDFVKSQSTLPGHLNLPQYRKLQLKQMVDDFLKSDSYNIKR